MFLLLLFFFIAIIVIATALLPQITGLATYSKNPNFQKSKTDKSKYDDDDRAVYDDHSATGGYVPPDEQIDSDDLTKAKLSKKDIIGMGSGVYNKVSKLTKDDLPIKLNLKSQEGQTETLKRRNIARRNLEVSNDSNPDNYDYDLNELIEEELEIDAIDLKKTSLQNNDYIGV